MWRVYFLSTAPSRSMRFRLPADVTFIPCSAEKVPHSPLSSQSSVSNAASVPGEASCLLYSSELLAPLPVRSLPWHGHLEGQSHFTFMNSIPRKIISDKSLYTFSIASLGLIARCGVAELKGMPMEDLTTCCPIPLPFRGVCPIITRPQHTQIIAALSPRSPTPNIIQQSRVHLLGV